MMTRTVDRNDARISSWFTRAIFTILLAGTAPESSALVIDAIGDIWIRESDPTGVYANDLVSVWDGTTTDQRRSGVLLFDLSSTVGVTIDSVFLNLFDRADGRSTTTALVQQATLLTTTPPTFPAGIETYTWEEFATFDEGQNESALASLGAFDIEAGDMIGGYEPSDFGTAGDITLLEQTRDAQSGNQANLVAFILKAVSGERDWGDIEFEATPPQLVINESAPDPGDFDNSGAVDMVDYQIMIDPNNWLQTVPAGTLGGRGDLTGDGFVDLVDFSAFKPIFEAANPGVPLAASVPEPTTLGGAVLVALCSVAARRRRYDGLSKPSRSGRLDPLPPGSAVRRMVVLTLCLVASGGTALVGHAVTLEATSDVWIREADPDRPAFESDLISVWSSFGNDGARRYGVVEFDVSSLDGINVTFAGLQLWDENNGFSDDAKPIKQSAVAIDTTGGTQATDLTWNIYQSEYSAGATPLEGLGLYDLPEQPSPDAFQNSVGTAADQALIESIAANQAGNQILTLVMIADELDGVDYAHSWGDGPDGFGGMNAQLVINEPFPEDVELALHITAATGAMSIVNPGVDPAENTTFEIDGYLIQSPADDGLDPLNPTGFTGLSGAGETGWDIVAPTSNALTELSLTSSVTLEEGDSFSLGNGYVAGAAEDPGLTFQYNLAGGETAFGDVIFLPPPTGPVDGDDFLVIQRTDPSLISTWEDQYGTTLSQAAATPTPEPSAWLLLCSGTLAAAAVRRRR